MRETERKMKKQTEGIKSRKRKVGRREKRNLVSML